MSKEIPIRKVFAETSNFEMIVPCQSPHRIQQDSEQCSSESLKTRDVVKFSELD